MVLNAPENMPTGNKNTTENSNSGDKLDATRLHLRNQLVDKSGLSTPCRAWSAKRAKHQIIGVFRKLIQLAKLGHHR